MNFFKKLMGENGGEKPPTVNELLKTIEFDLSGCEQKIDRERELGWLNGDRVAHMLKLIGPVTWDFDLRQPQKAYNHYQQECSGFKGQLLSCEVTRIDGCEALVGLFKYRAPENPRGRMFVGIIWIPFAKFTLMFNIEAVETGTTGLRESVVYLETGPTESEEPEPEPIQVNSAEEMFAHMAKQPLKVLPSDDAKWDAKFPEHPLSLVRARLQKVIETLKLPEDLKQTPPHRVG